MEPYLHMLDFNQDAMSLFIADSYLDMDGDVNGLTWPREYLDRETFYLTKSLLNPPS
jgi:hypothetical protein